MNAGVNVWVCNCGHEWKSAKKLEGCPKCGDDCFGAKYTSTRVRGDKAEIYKGYSEWAKFANSEMLVEANQHFRGRN